MGIAALVKPACSGDTIAGPNKRSITIPPTAVYFASGNRLFTAVAIKCSSSRNGLKYSNNINKRKWNKKKIIILLYAYIYVYMYVSTLEHF